FQAEDGIRDRTVTGVQTCALPIYTAPANPGTYTVKATTQAESSASATAAVPVVIPEGNIPDTASALITTLMTPIFCTLHSSRSKIGRASCRERVCTSGVVVPFIVK